MKNKPYKKVHVDGVLLNPITKEKPYLHPHPTTTERRRFTKMLIKQSKKRR